MWCQIISSSSQMAISPCDDYLPVTIFCPCPEVVIISDILCSVINRFVVRRLVTPYPILSSCERKTTKIRKRVYQVSRLKMTKRQRALLCVLCLPGGRRAELATWRRVRGRLGDGSTCRVGDSESAIVEEAGAFGRRKFSAFHKSQHSKLNYRDSKKNLILRAIKPGKSSAV